MARAVQHPGLVDSSGAELAGRLVEVKGIDTFIYDHGIGEPIIFLHGYGDTADSWRKVVPALNHNYRVIAIDIPPFGRSEDPGRVRPTPKLMDFYIDFFPALMDTLGTDSATLVGHSLGAALAMEVAISFPRKVDGLVLLSPAGLGTAPPWFWHLIVGNYIPWTTVLRLPMPVVPTVLSSAVSKFFSGFVIHEAKTFNNDIQHLTHLYRSRKEVVKLLDAGKALISSYTGDLIERIAALDCPVETIWGAQDKLIPVDHSQGVKRVLPQANIRIIKGCGHYPQIESPRTVSDAIAAVRRHRYKSHLRSA